MTTTNLEGRIRDVLANQAAALQPPDVRPDDTLVVVGGPHRDRGPRRSVLVAAAAALVLVAGIAIANRHPDSSVGVGSASTGGAFHFETPQVVLDAASVEVDTAGRTFVPPAATGVNSDPGTPNEYTTLELEWDAQGVPMRIYMYFASDGTNWWATELRTYDGSPGGEWIEMPGTYFRSPLGTAYQGDLDIRSLHIHGLRLEAFRRPDVCTNPTKPLALVANHAKIETDAFAGGGYAATVTLVDTATCSPVSTDGVSVSISSDNPEIAAVQPAEGLPSDPTGVIRISLSIPKAGTTAVHVVVRDKTTDELIDKVDIPVIAHPTSDPIPSPTSLSPTTT
ncbi:MAG: hypothetical protein ACXVI2_13245 [Ilumatobacteraceae bacterium]